ncbi:MAG: MFS transporter [Rhodothermales bacterium]
MSKKKPNTRFVLLALWLLVFSSSSQVIIIAPILPRIGEALNIAETLQGTLVTSYAILLSVFALITGPISDKIGRRRILLAGSVFMTGALVLHGIANSYLSLLTVRGLAGIGGGILSGAAVAYVGDYFPYERRGWANGWIMSGIAVGQVVGIPLGKILADQFDFRVPFLVFAGTMGIAWLLIWFFVPQPDVRRDPRPLSIKRAVVNYGRLLRERDPAVAVLAFFMMFFSFGLFVIYLPTWLENDIRITGTEVASLFFVGGLAHVVAGPLAGRLSDRVGRKPLIVTSCLGLGLVMLVTTYVMVNIWMAYLLFAVAMVMVAMRLSPLQALMTALVSDERRGILMSLAIAVGQIGVGIGGAAAGLTYIEFGYVSNTVMGAASIIAMALLVQYGLSEPEKKPATSLSPDAAEVVRARSS